MLEYAPTHNGDQYEELPIYPSLELMIMEKSALQKKMFSMKEPT